MHLDQRLKSLVRWVGLLLGVLTLLFVLNQFRDHPGLEQLKGMNWQQWLSIAAFCLVYSAASLLLAGAWWKLLVYLKLSVSLRWSVSAYGFSQLAKYLPGNVFQFAGRQALGMAAGLPARPLLYSTVLELMLLVGAGLLVCIVLLPVPDWSNGQAALLILATLVLVWIVAALMGSRHLANAFALQLAFLIISGLVFVGIVSVLDPTLPLPVNTVIFLAAAHVGAWLAGLLVPGAPAGIGIREFALLFLLSQTLPPELLLAAIALARLVNLTGDIVFFAVAAADRKQLSA